MSSQMEYSRLVERFLAFPAYTKQQPPQLLNRTAPPPPETHAPPEKTAPLPNKCVSNGNSTSTAILTQLQRAFPAAVTLSTRVLSSVELCPNTAFPPQPRPYQQNEGKMYDASAFHRATTGNRLGSLPPAPPSPPLVVPLPGGATVSPFPTDIPTSSSSLPSHVFQNGVAPHDRRSSRPLLPRPPASSLDNHLVRHNNNSADRITNRHIPYDVSSPATLHPSLNDSQSPFPQTQPAIIPTRPDCFRCPNCAFTGTTRLEVRRHRKRQHRGEDRLWCDLCKKKFSSSGSLARHNLIHENKKPYNCPYCPYACRESGALSRHVLTHTGGKPFKCEMCSYTCRESGALTRHRRIHVERQFKCTVCSFSCREQHFMNRHMEMQHNTGNGTANANPP